MAIRVLNKGELTPSSASNQNTSNNPMVHCDNLVSSTNPLAVIIYPDDTTSETIQRIVLAADMLTDYSNLEKTEGNTLKVYDSFSQEGIDLSSLTDITTHHYFVMVHSDNHLLHHFAKITEIHTTDAFGDSIKFEPSLGNEINHGVKFKLFKGPAVNSDFISIGLGIKKDLQNSLQVARPYFWFNRDVNELESNTKHFIRVKEITVGTSLNLSTSSSDTTFLVSQNYANEIKDYGKFTLKTKLVDNLRNLDIEGFTPITFTGDMHAVNHPDEIRNITGISSGTINDLLYRGIVRNNVPDGTYVTEILSSNSIRISQNVTAAVSTTSFTVSHSNESHALASNDLTDYETSFFNARRDADDLILPSASNYTSRGPTRYLHYDFSKDKANYSYNVIDLKINESIKGKTSFSETQIADMMKIYPNKLELHSPMRARQRLSRDKLNKFVDTGLSVGANGMLTGNDGLGNQIVSVHIVNVNSYFTAGEEIKIEDRLYIILSINSGTNTITLLQADTTIDGSPNTYSRLETESSYTDIGTPTINVGDSVFRRAYSPFNKTLINSFDLISNRHEDLYLITTSQNATYNYFKCSAIDASNNLLTFTVNLDKYLEEGLHLNNDYYLYYEKLNGTIEVLDYYRTDGQSIMRVEGRDIMSKILSPVVNNDTLFSEDIIYSSFGTINHLEQIGFVEASFNSQVINIKDTSNVSASITLIAGDKLYVRSKSNFFKPLGTVLTGNTGNQFNLERESNVECGGDTFTNGGVFELYKAVKNGSQPVKNYIFNKALSSNILVDSVTSLSGSSNKGLYFTSGVSLNNLGNDDTPLVNTSSSTDSRAIGYHISKVSGDIDGADYQCVLGDGASTESHENILTINTLMDFSVISVKENDGGKIIEIAPYIPATLGRLESNLANNYDATKTSIGFTLGDALITDLQNFINVSSSDSSYVALSELFIRRNDSVFINDRFVGFALEQHLSENHCFIVLDRQVFYETGQTVTIIHNRFGLSKGTLGDGPSSDNKNTHELELINVGHLHGGKIISNVFDYESVNGLRTFDFGLKYNDGSEITSFEKFGNPSYAIYSLEKGDNTNYAASYKVNFHRDTYAKVKSRLVDSSNIYNHLPIEGRGFYTPTYSNFDDKQIGVSSTLQTYGYPSTFPFIIASGNVFSTAANAQLVAGKFNTNTSQNIQIRKKSVDRMFLFVNSDENPYHENRLDSLCNPLRTRNISDYGIVGLLPLKNTNTQDDNNQDINTQRHTNVDEEYSFSNIVSSDKSINSLMNVGIMRLTEVVVDWSFNQIDPEDIQDEMITDAAVKEIFTPITLEEDGVAIYAQAGSYNVGGNPSSIQFYDAPTGGNIVNFASTLVEAGDAIIADGTGFLIGFCLNNNPNSLMSDALFANSSKSAYYIGEVKKIKKANIAGSDLKGRQKDTFMGFDDTLSMLRTGYFNSPAHTSTQKQLVLDNNSLLPIHAHSGGSTPAESLSWFALQFNDSNGNKVGFFFWFNVENSDGNQIDTIPAEYANNFSPHSDGITYTSVEIQLSNGYSSTDFHAALATAFDSVNLRTNHVFGGNQANDSDAATYGGTTVTQLRTKRAAPSNFYQTTSTLNHHPDSTVTTVNVDITADNTGWGGNPSAYYNKWSEILGGQINNYVSIPRKGGTYLPVSITTQYTSTPTFYSDILTNIAGSPLSTSFADISTTDVNELKYTDFIPVALRGFVIEDSKGKKKINAGESFPKIKSLFRKNISSSHTIFGLTSEYSTWFNKYKYYMDAGVTKEENADLPNEGNGLKIGFKPRLDASLATLISGTQRSNSGNRIYNYSFNTNNTKLSWLRDLDLTGCYLVRVSGTNIDNNYFVEGFGFAYVISHEIDPSDSNKVILTTSTNLGPNTYRILQPNHTCFYDFTPTQINIGQLSSSYTKKPKINECYEDSLKSHALDDVSMDNDSINDQEAIGSVYVLIDLTGDVSSGDKIINTSMRREFFDNLPTTICLSDGEETFKTGMQSNSFSLTFDSLKELKGIVSLSEIITLNVGKNFNKDSKRCLIGNTVNIVQESEELAKSLLEKENISFTSINEPSYPLFTAPNFQGNDLLSATRFLLGKKDRDIEVIDGNFVIDDEEATNKYANVLLSENSKYQIYEFEKQKTTFSFYNEVIVYGSSHKSIKKDLRSVKKIGRKTLEVFDNKLITQEDVDKEARELLKLHSQLNESYKVTVSTTGLEQIKSGDIIQFELKRENVDRDEYIILSVEHRLSNLMELELGKYAKSLDDRLVEILQETKDTKSHLRSKQFAEKTETIETLDTIKIKEIRTLIRKRSTTGNPLTLGFGTNLNTSSVELGFEGGQTITITNLREENI